MSLMRLHELLNQPSKLFFEQCVLICRANSNTNEAAKWAADGRQSLHTFGKLTWHNVPDQLATLPQASVACCQVAYWPWFFRGVQHADHP